MNKLKPFEDVYSSEWTPPFRFRKETPANVVQWWLETARKAGSPIQQIDPRTQMAKAEQLIGELGYVRVLKVLRFMSTPNSKFFQYPYGLRSVRKANLEFDKVANGTVDAHSGWIGPSMRNLSNEDKTE